MNKFIVALAVSVLLAGNAFAGGMVERKSMKPIVDNVSVDNPSWTGEKYNSNSAKFNQDFIGVNVNYIRKIEFSRAKRSKVNKNNVRISFYSADEGKSVYTKTLKDRSRYLRLPKVQSTFGSLIETQDSGVLINEDRIATWRPYLLQRRIRNDRDGNRRSNWYTKIALEVSQGEADAIRAELNAWIIGKNIFITNK